ncbi:MAG: alpha/beta fold hydrolase [Streptosporangiales bacterium]|nr:alpha/beta fold hydrolase [Streptosporangiales bacterium]
MDVGAPQAAREVYDRLPGRRLLRAWHRAAVAATTRTVTAARATLGEAAWVAAHAATYPLGLVSDRYLSWSPADPFGPLRRHTEPMATSAAHADVPVLLVHGLADNRSVYTILARELRRCGFRNVYALNAHPFPGDARTAAARLAEEVERVCAETGEERVHIVGHSLGGLVARYYVQLLDGDERTATLVTIGTPHHGTTLARLLPYRMTGQLLPGSPLLAELAGPAGGCRTRFVCFWSDLDQLMSPRETAVLVHDDLDVRSIAVTGARHASLPVNAGVVSGICRILDE